MGKCVCLPSLTTWINPMWWKNWLKRHLLTSASVHSYTKHNGKNFFGFCFLRARVWGWRWLTIREPLLLHHEDQNSEPSTHIGQLQLQGTLFWPNTDTHTHIKEVKGKTPNRQRYDPSQNFIFRPKVLTHHFSPLDLARQPGWPWTQRSPASAPECRD